MQFAPDGRLFVCEQGGRLRVIKNGALLPTPFLTLTVSSSGERGLLGVAFDPAFASNQFIYVYYTATSPACAQSHQPLHGQRRRRVVPGSEVVILELDNLSSATNHNGGALAFGPDGKLYAAVGENANGANAQSMNNLLGKMLRINPDGSIPTDNPFFTTAAGNNRAIWALGLRNPFTFAFNPDGPSCSSTTSVRTRGKRSTTGERAPTTGGRRPKGRQRIPVRRDRDTPTTTATADRARSPAARSIRRPPRSFPPHTPAITSSPTTAPGSSAGSIRVRQHRHALRDGHLVSRRSEGRRRWSLYYLARGSGSGGGVVFE